MCQSLLLRSYGTGYSVYTWGMHNFVGKDLQCRPMSDSYMYVSCGPLRIFWNNDTTSSTWVPRVSPTTGWIPGFSACGGQHAWHSCRAGCIVISENPQELATHMVLLGSFRWKKTFIKKHVKCESDLNITLKKSWFSEAESGWWHADVTCSVYSHKYSSSLSVALWVRRMEK